MANYTESDAEYARQYVIGLLNKESRDTDTPVNLEIVPQISDLSVVDLEDDTEEFLYEIEFLSYFGLEAPAIQVGDENGEIVPMALNQFGFNGPFRFDRKYLRSRVYPTEYYVDWLYDHLRERINSLRRAETNFRTIPVEQSRSTFQRLAIDFLANRIAGLRNLKLTNFSTLNIFQRKNGPSISTPGCHFSVSTNSPGLRVFWSGGYRISANYFSSPTTPTTSVLQSGTYVFGVDGGAYGSSIQWDKKAFVTLPGNPSVHLNY